MSVQLEHVIACQDRLIGALDARDASGIEAATTHLADALCALEAEEDSLGIDTRRLEYAQRQANAARIRVNVLSGWTRQRIDRIAEIRLGSVSTYSNVGLFVPVT
jgi:hypothetical protein